MPTLLQKYFYTCNSNSKRTHEAGNTTSSIDKEKPQPKTINTTQEEKESKYFTLDYFSPSNTTNVMMNGGMCSMITNDEKSTGYVDLKGRFPYFSASGHEYLLFGYNYDSNSTLVEPLKNSQAKTIADGWYNIN